MKRALKYIVGSLALWFVVHTMIIAIDGLNDDYVKSDVGVIFGSKVNTDGTLSERLKARLDKGIQLYRDSAIRLVIVSGGLGKEGFYEGTKMYDYLLENGIPKSNIIVDNLGNNTEATAENLRKMNLKINSVLVISQYFHITRAKLAIKKIGYDRVYGAHPDYFEWRDFYSIVREFVGYYKYLLSGK